MQILPDYRETIDPKGGLNNQRWHEVALGKINQLRDRLQQLTDQRARGAFKQVDTNGNLTNEEAEFRFLATASDLIARNCELDSGGSGMDVGPLANRARHGHLG